MGSGSIAVVGAAACLLAAAVAFARRPAAAPWLAAAGAALLAGALGARGLLAGRWPLADGYEFSLGFALAVGVLVALAAREYPAGALGMAAGAAAALLLYTRFVLPAGERGVAPLAPMLDSAWLPLHTSVAALAYTAVTVAGTAGMAWLLGWEQEAHRRLLDAAASAAYPLLTLDLILGVIWSHAAWGHTWSWDLKEVWALATWLIYTMFWHVWRRPRWQGSPIAWLATAGLGAAVMTFLGVAPLARGVLGMGG